MGCEPLPGNEGMVSRLDLLQIRANHMEPALLATLESYHKIEAERFAQEGPGWQQLADSTVLSREYLGFSGTNPILGRTGQLEASFGGGGLMSEIVTGNAWQSLSNVVYAQFHQYGMGRNPLRKIVDISEVSPTALLWRSMLQEYLMTGTVSESSDSEIASVL